jgi:hypothetical protein
MSSVLSFVVMIVIVVAVAALGMWAAQRFAARVDRRPANAPEAAGIATRHLSPDGRYALVTTRYAAGSHWVETPTLLDLHQERPLLALDRRWSADGVSWSADGRALTLQLRKYPADVPGVTLTIALAAAEARLRTRGGEEHVPLAAVPEWLDGYVRRFGRSPARPVS